MPGEQQTTGGILSKLTPRNWRKASSGDVESRSANSATFTAITLEQALDELRKLHQLPKWREFQAQDNSLLQEQTTPKEELTNFLTEI